MNTRNFKLAKSRGQSLITYSTTSHNSKLISHYFHLLHSSPNAHNLGHLHAQLLRNGLYSNVILSSKLVLMYSKHQKLLPSSYNVFLHMPHRNIYSWNIMMGEFARSGFGTKSLELLVEMLNYGVGPDEFTLPIVVRACASLGAIRQGMHMHCLCVKLGFADNLFVASALVFLYAGLARIIDARQLFDQMSQRDAVLWTAMFGGYAQCGEPELAFSVFGEMVSRGIELDGVVMVSLLLVCSQLGWLKHGKGVHGWCVRRCLGLGLSLGNALIDVYVKGGVFSCAHRVFDNMPERDVISWSSLILGYGLNGCVDIALALFEMMCMKGVEPNSVTFLGVLSACGHAGMVGSARAYFDMMKDYEVIPELKHYACMVDVLGRAGFLVEAERFIEEMPMEPDGAVWGALLGGCRVHCNVEVGERVATKLLGLEPKRSGYYVLLANIYADAGLYADAERVRRFMMLRNIGKVPGQSVIESDGRSLSRENEKLFHSEVG